MRGVANGPCRVVGFRPESILNGRRGWTIFSDVASLEQLLSWGPMQLAGPRKRLLALRGRPIAFLSHEPSEYSAVVARVGGDQSIGELLGGLVGHRPCGVVAICSSEGEKPLALRLSQGGVRGVGGRGRLDMLGAWAMEFRRRHGATDLDLPRVFLQERTLEGLAAAEGAGSIVVLVQGEVEWVGEKPDAVVPMHHVLLEHARRADELPRVMAQLPNRDAVVIPMSEPGERPTRPKQAKSDWDFFDDPDEAAQLEWADARRVFRMCDGATSVDELAARTMLGPFRTYSAVVTLLERHHVCLAAGLVHDASALQL